MSFSNMTQDLQKELRKNIAQIRFLLKKNPAIGYTKISEIGAAVGKKYNIKMLVNFPQREKILDFDSYGMQDISVLVDMKRTNFSIQRSEIKSKAIELLGNVKVEDAYMYEGKEGVKVFLDKGRIDILPHSLHVWCRFSQSVINFCDWLFENVYQLSQGDSLETKSTNS